MKKKDLIYFIIFFVLFGVIFKNWVFSPYIIGGDWPFFYQEYINHFSFLPPDWNPLLGNGFGGQSITYAIDSYLYFTGWLFSVLLHLPWHLVYQICWFGMFLGLSIVSSVFLYKIIFPKSSIWVKLLAAFLYTTNTYILLVVGGGQMGVALGYAITPLVLACFIVLKERIDDTIYPLMITNTIICSLLLAIQVMFDFRMAYVTIVAVIFYQLVCMGYSASRKNAFTIFLSLFFIFILPIGITVLLHAFWLLPLLTTKSNPVSTLGNAYTSLSSVKYFSFATFENAISLLHPYWPENIFGKIGFMKPEFLVLPIVAYSSLLFLPIQKIKVVGNAIASMKYQTRKENNFILFFALLGLLGAFLAKGTNDPFGSIYLWMFGHLPGFIIFRDPTKWYTLIALSYSILIPFTVYSVYEFLNSKFKIQNSQLKIKFQNFFPHAFVVLFILYLLFLIRPALFGQLGTTFQSHTVPQEYISLKEVLMNDPSFSRVLWIPKQSRFAYYSTTHPSVEAMPLLHATSEAELFRKLRDKKTQELFIVEGIKYVIIPYDNLGDIFIKDRKYDPDEFKQYKKDLKQITWLTQDKAFRDLEVFQTKKYDDRFSLLHIGKVSYIEKQFDIDQLSINSPGKNNLLFSETFSSDWQLRIGHGIINPKRTINGLMSFEVPAGKYESTVIFAQQKWYHIGLIISILSLVISFTLYIMLK